MRRFPFRKICVAAVAFLFSFLFVCLFFSLLGRLFVSSVLHFKILSVLLLLLFFLACLLGLIFLVIFFVKGRKKHVDSNYCCSCDNIELCIAIQSGVFECPPWCEYLVEKIEKEP